MQQWKSVLTKDTSSFCLHDQTAAAAKEDGTRGHLDVLLRGNEWRGGYHDLPGDPLDPVALVSGLTNVWEMCST